MTARAVLLALPAVLLVGGAPLPPTLRGGAVVHQAAAPHHAAPVAALAAGMRRIEPPLDPKSNRKFWKHDFPHDHQPEADFRGSRPAGMYPVFQNDDVYDRDYVKDENGDNGEWAAQSRYDTLRTEVVAARKREAASRAAKEQAKRDLEAASEAVEPTAAAAAAADSAADQARAAHDRAEAALRKFDVVGEGCADPGGNVPSGLASPWAAGSNATQCRGLIPDTAAAISALEVELALCQEALRNKTEVLEQHKHDNSKSAEIVAAEQAKVKEELALARAELATLEHSSFGMFDADYATYERHDASLRRQLEKHEEDIVRARELRRSTQEELRDSKAAMTAGVARLRAAFRAGKARKGTQLIAGKPPKVARSSAAGSQANGYVALLLAMASLAC